jgi:hypothetical protein
LKIRVSLVRFRVRAPYKTRPCSNAGPFCYARLVEIWRVPVGLTSSGHRVEKRRAMDAASVGHGGDVHRLCVRRTDLVSLAFGQLLITHGNTASTLAS